MKFQPNFFMPHYKKKSPLRPKPTVSQNLPISKLCATARHSKTLRPIQMDRRANCRPRCDGADSRTRTDDLLITNELLYQLSHISTSDLSIIHQNHTFVNINSRFFLKTLQNPYQIVISYVPFEYNV